MTVTVPHGEPGSVHPKRTMQSRAPKARVGTRSIGPAGLIYDTPRGRDGGGNPAQWLQRGFLGAPAASIASGTSEIMRGIIAMQVLGLPRGV